MGDDPTESTEVVLGWLANDDMKGILARQKGRHQHGPETHDQPTVSALSMLVAIKDIDSLFVLVKVQEAVMRRWLSAHGGVGKAPTEDFSKKWTDYTFEYLAEAALPQPETKGVPMTYAMPICAGCGRGVDLRKTYCDSCRQEKRRESWRLSKWKKRGKPDEQVG